MKYYAHSLEGQPPEKWQLLEEHLRNVAEMAARFAKPFGGDEWAGLAGLWHDLGKYSNEFQSMLYTENGLECHLETKPGRVVHSQAGGHLASLNEWKGADRVLSWIIMGHHAGLTDFESEKIGPKALEPKMRTPDQSEYILKNVPFSIANQEMPRQPIPSGADPAFFLRMLFSCVVDADFLDTENFMDKSRAGTRNRQYPSLQTLLPTFDDYIDTMCRKAQSTTVNEIRAQVLEQCRKKAEKPPDVFSLTVPTGGGKTLSSLAFALRHAVKHKKNRIIYVIPYTSIIEQTADVFRKIPGFQNAVIEHHSNVVTTEEDKETVRNRLAAENWDAPVIVTTSVQFFESLYACRTSRCRKLHNIVNSVVIFDEAQCLPPKYLRPVVFAIRELFRHYRVTPVLCTATQPVLTRTEAFDFKFREGFENVTEIVENPDGLATKLKRVETVLHGGRLTPVDLPELAVSIMEERKAVLCIVNRKDDARKLARLLPVEQTIHLSTNMCAEHRTRVLAEVKKWLADKKGPVFVISTSLVEAGVDIDFPVVYRALSGLDSIAQAAGRCNREGKLTDLGKTVVFVPAEQPAYVRQSAGIARELLEAKNLDGLLTPANYEKYFRQHFWQLGQDALDAKNILKISTGRSMNYYFRTAAQQFRFIEDDWQATVVVPYGEAVNLLGRLTSETWRQHEILGRLGRFSIGISRYFFEALAAKDYIRETGYPGVYMLDYTLYDDCYGFVPPDESTGVDPEKFFA
ncbi:MAG: CRISPR-associated helicase Cas3' [Proteobacteria bacterium]|nr:CRISPR-associated helicase Cas3' [Pseudomonadota bacterium]